MPVAYATSRIYWQDDPAGALHQGDTKVWEPAPSWTPAVIPGLTVWLDASELPSGPLAQWPDQSGQGHHGAVVGTPPPVVVADALNGLPVVRHSYLEGRIRGDTGLGSSGLPMPLANYTLIYVARMVGYPGRIYSGVYPEVNLAVGYALTAWNYCYADAYIDMGEPYNGPTPWQTLGLVGHHDGTAFNLDFYADGEYRASSAVVGGLGSRYHLSGYDAVTDVETSDGEVAELLIYNRPLDDAERTQVEQYLNAKWGIPQFTPTDIANLFVWLDATQVAATDGTHMPSWTDSSGHGLHAVTNQSAGPVIYRSASLNGHPAMSFGESGVGSEMVFLPGQPVGDRTVFMVVSAPLGGQIGSYHTVQLQNADPYVQTYGAATIHTYSVPDVDSHVSWSGVGQMITAWTDYINRAQGLEVDGTLASSIYDPPVSESSAEFVIGGLKVAGYYMRGLIGEILIYNRCLTFSERDDVMNYLRTKWELP